MCIQLKFIQERSEINEKRKENFSVDGSYVYAHQLKSADGKAYGCGL